MFLLSPAVQRFAKNWAEAQRKLGMSFAQAAENLARNMKAFDEANRRARKRVSE